MLWWYVGILVGRDWRRDWVDGWRNVAWLRGEECSADISAVSTGC